MRTSLFLHDFTVLDYAYMDAELGIRGDSLYVSAELSGDLDAHGFIQDFGPAKKWLKALVDNELDHKLLVPKKLASKLQYSAPASAQVVLEANEINMPVLEDFLASLALKQAPSNIKNIKFILREDARFHSQANFRYTHGLRYHDGNCQRLFHGHRNPIEVWLDNQRATELEELLSQEWQDVHFVEASTLKNLAELDLTLGHRKPQHPGLAKISYDSAHGKFFGEIAASRIVVLDTEPSIENIARLAHARLREEGVSGNLMVRAYEGLNKGASFS